MAQATGIHISASRITAVLLKGSSKSPTVVGAGWMPRPPEDEMDLGASVRHLLGEHGLSRDPSVVTVENDDALMRAVAMPFTRYEDIKKVLKGEAEAALPGISVDQVALTSHFLGAHGAEGQVMTIAMRKERLRALLGTLSQGGVDPIGVTLEGFSLAEALIGLGHAPDEGTVVLADADADCLRLTLVKNRTVRLVRTLRLPLMGPDESFNIGVGRELHDELTRTLVSGGLMQQPDRVLLVGSIAHEPMLASALHSVLGVPAEPMPADGLGGRDESLRAMPGGLAAFGAALQGLGSNHTGVNLRVDEFGFQRTFDQVAGALAMLATVVFITCLVLFVDYQQQHKEVVKNWNDATLSPAFKRFRDSWRRVRPTAAELKTDLTRLEKEVPRKQLMGNMIGLLQQEVNRLKVGPVKAEFEMRSQLDVWKAFADQLGTFKPSSKYWVVDQLDITTRDVTMKGWLGTDGGRGDLDEIVGKLKAHELFGQTQAGSTQVKKGPDGDERLEFSLSCVLPEETQSKKAN